MKKEKIVIDDVEIPIEEKDVEFSGVYDPYSLAEIEQFILDAGSDNLGIFGGKYEGGIHSQQISDELAPCILTILESGQIIKSYLEIGVAAGGTTYLIDHFFKPGKIILIDNNKHPKAGLRAEVLKGIEYTELIGNSHDVEIIKRATGPFDLIILDGDHSYEGLIADMENYLLTLNAGGFLIIHDSVFAEFNVRRVVQEIRDNAILEFIGEYISQKHPAPCGIALFRKGEI